MPLKTIDEIKKETLEQEYASYVEDLHVMNSAIINSIDLVIKLKYERQRSELFEKLAGLENELKQLEKTNYRDFLPEIDYKTSRRIFHQVYNQFGRKGGGAIFIAQNGLSMKVELLRDYIVSELKKNTFDFRYYSIGASALSMPNEYGIVKSLNGYFGCEVVVENLPEATENLIHKIIDSLESGYVCFIEIKQFECVYPQDRVLKWFILNFWHKLINQVISVSNLKRRVRAIALISYDSPLADNTVVDDIKDASTCLDLFDLVEFPLQNWTLEDVQEWLELYSGMNADKIDRISSRVIQVSNGIPHLAYDAILNYLYR